MISKDACALLQLFSSGVVILDAQGIHCLTRIPPDRINSAVCELKVKDMVQDISHPEMNPEGFRFFSIRLTDKGQQVLMNVNP
jgi:hypothetical protein